jgi:nitrate/nitrite transporter NarK
MSQLRAVADRLADRIGGSRMLALLLPRALAIVAAVAWLVLAPVEYRGSGALAFVLTFRCALPGDLA